MLRFDGANGTLEPVPGQAGAIFVASGSGGLSVANGLAFDPPGNLYVANQDKHQILRFDGKSGAFIGVFIAADSGGLKEPRGIGFGPDGNLYVTDAGDDAVRRYNGKTGRPLPAAGKSRAVFVSPGSGNLKAPAFLVFR